ncbi:DUF637 domain-containing protein [Veillonella sp. R32]|uniref:DUF637 domain-containing protein n=1 Tax=Veillonella sp. R32 TaxID=2021312 RepID=UPI001EE3E715|nr:DUF637 domain-containing protein [Veillonella sp. R32]
MSIQPTGRIGSIGGAHNIGETQSQYASVTSQAGIYAGAGGLTVDVGDTTHLTGAVLHSEAAPSKNVVKTGTLVMEDIHNVAEYTSKSKGLSYVYDDEYEQAKRKLQAKEPLSPGEIHTLNNLHNQVGLLPDLSVGTHKKETSVTQSAITDGQLLITDGVIDIETINRDTTQSLHRLQDIFDAKSVKEKEELARLLSKNINEGIHILSEHKHWAEGSPQKIALHALSAGLSAQVAKGDFFAGAVAGGTNEALLPKLQQMLATDDPAVLQAASAILGYATNKTIGKDGWTGAALAQYGTKWNSFKDYYHKVFDVIFVKTDWVKHALKEALITEVNTVNERILLEFGNGDTIRINSGHAYYRDHKSQKEGLPSFKYTNKEDILIAVLSTVLINYESGSLKENSVTNTEISMFLYDVKGKRHYMNVQVDIYKRGQHIDVSNFYPIRFA